MRTACLKRVRDFAQVMGRRRHYAWRLPGIALDRLEIDELGLDAIDRRMLLTIIRNYGGGPVGLETLAAAIGEEAVTLEDVYEPYLMQIGFLSRTPRGRCVTPHGIPASGDCRHAGDRTDSGDHS